MAAWADVAAGRVYPLAERLCAKVQLKQKSGSKGQLVIDYNSLDELDGILERIR